MNKTIWMKSLVCIFFLLLCGCSTRNEGDKAKEQNEVGKSQYTLEKTSENDIFGVTLAVGRTDSGYYAAMRDRVRGTSVYFYEENFIQSKCVDLEQVEGYDVRKVALNREGGYYAFLSALNADKSGFTGFMVAVYDKDGRVSNKTEITQVVFDELGDKPVFVNAILTRDGKLILPVVDEDGKEQLTVISTKGVVLKRLPLTLSSESNNVATHLVEIREETDGKIISLVRESEFAREGNTYSVYEIDIAQDMVIKTSSSFENRNQMKLATGINKDSLYIVNDEGLYEWDKTNNTMNTVFPMKDLGMTLYDIQELFQTSNNEWYLWGVTQKADSEKNQSGYNWLKFVQQSEQSNKLKTITFAMVGLGNTFDYEINELQKTDNSIKIEKVRYANQDLLFADLSAGNYPDMILINDEIDADALIEKGVLADLKVFLNEDAELSEKDFMNQAVQIYRNGTQLFAIPRYMVVTALVGNVDYIGECDNWTFHEFTDFVASLQDSSIVTAGMSRTDILDYIFMQSMGDYVNFDEKICDFEEQSFYDVLSLLAIYPKDNIGSRKTLEEVMNMIEDEQLILMPVSIGDIQEMELYISEFNGKGRFMEFPTQAGGYGFFPVGETIAITENSENKDIAWELWKKCMKKRDTGHLAFPTYMKAYEEIMEQAKSMSREDTPSMTLELGGSILEIPHLNINQIEILDKMIKKAKPRQNVKTIIRDIVLEEAEYFFGGQKTKEEVASVIQNRVHLYLQE